MTLKIDWEEAHLKYLKLNSLIKVSEIYSCSISTVYRNFTERGYLVSDQKIAGEKRRRTGSLYVDKFGRVFVNLAIKGRQKRSHYNWIKVHGPVPNGYALHHKNLIISDDRIENLQLLTHSAHASLHNKLRFGDKNRD